MAASESKKTLILVVRITVLTILVALVVVASLDFVAKSNAEDTMSAWRTTLQQKNDEQKDLTLEELNELIKGSPEVTDGKQKNGFDVKIYTWKRLFWFLGDYEIQVEYEPRFSNKLAEKALSETSLSNYQLRQSSYAEMNEVLHELKIDRVDRVLLDLGLSSDQLNDEMRGFSIDSEGPLDLRFDTSRGRSAAKWIAKVDESELADVLARYGEERYSKRIAAEMVQRRSQSEMKTAADVLAAVEAALSKQIRGTDRRKSAIRVFQALRIVVNDELGQLETALDSTLYQSLALQGRVAVISFHSLEDRLVKTAFRDKERWHNLTPKPITATTAEKRMNPHITRRQTECRVSGDETGAVAPGGTSTVVALAARFRRLKLPSLPSRYRRRAVSSQSGLSEPTGLGARCHAIVAILIACWLALAARLVFLQWGAADDFADRADRQRTFTEPVPARPGEILDRHGRVLATTTVADSLWVNPQQFGDSPRRVQALAEAVGLDPKVLQKRLRDHAKKDFLWVRRRMSESQAQAVENLKLPEGTIGFRKEFQRKYPQGVLAAHLIGLRDIDEIGRGGIEESCDRLLRGASGRRTLIRDAHGKVVAIENETSIAPRPGKTLVLTIDSVLQIFVERELDKLMKTWKPKAAGVIVVEPRSGDLLAMASRPGFDPNRPIDVPDAAWKNINIASAFEPGSTFKPMVVATALSRGLIQKDDSFHCGWGKYRMGPRLLHDHHPYGSLNIKDILVKSSNIGMAKIGEKLTNQGLYESAALFGFGRRTGSGLPGEIPGSLRPLKKWNIYSTGSIPMGQEISVTPLQLIMAHAALANGGKLISPQLVLRIGTKNDSPAGRARLKHPTKRRRKRRPDSELGTYEIPDTQEGGVPMRPKAMSFTTGLIEAEAEIRREAPPPIPNWTFFSGVFGFPWRVGVISRWGYMSFGFTAMGLVAGVLMWAAAEMLLAIPFFALPIIWLTFLTVSYASACWSAILQDTAAGNDEIHGWLEPDWRDWFAKMMYLMFVGCVAGVAAWGVGLSARAVAGDWGFWVTFGSVLFFVYPVVLLSSLEADSAWVPLTRPVLNSVVRFWWAWLLYYLLSAVVAAVYLVPLIVGMWQEVFWLTLLLTGPIAASVVLIHARLLGRLAWKAIVQPSELAQMKRKKKVNRSR
eukprot:g22037.t1